MQLLWKFAAAVALALLLAIGELPAAAARRSTVSLEDVEDMNALSALQGFIGGQFRAFFDDLGVLKTYLEKENMLQLGDVIQDAKETRRAPASQATAGHGGATPQVMKFLLQDMQKRFKARVVDATKHEEQSKSWYKKLSESNNFPNKMKITAKALRESERKEYHAMLRLSNGGLDKIDNALTEIQEMIKAGKGATKGRTLGQIRKELVKFAIDTSTEIKKQHPFSAKKRPSSGRRTLLQKSKASAVSAHQKL